VTPAYRQRNIAAKNAEGEDVMRIAGHNVVAIIAAAIVMYLIEFLIYGVMTPAPVYQALAHISAEDQASNLWKMPFGIIGPLIWAVGLSFANGWRGAKSWQAGAITGLLTGVFFMIAARFYQWGYGPTGLHFYLLDAFHFVVVGVVGGAILAAWPAQKAAA
jgi:uncharacterized membrane protein